MKLEKRDDFIAHSPFGTRLREQMDIIEEAFYGWPTKICDLTKDRFGLFSHTQTRELISAIIEGYSFNPEDKEYMNVLLYLAIRAQSAGISNVLVPKSMKFFVTGDTKSYVPKGLLRPVADKSFRGLKEEFENSYVDNAFNHCMHESRPGETLCIVSPAMAATITTIYTMLTDKIVDFPNPYEDNLKEYKDFIDEEIRLDEEYNNYIMSDAYLEDMQAEEPWYPPVSEDYEELLTFEDDYEKGYEEFKESVYHYHTRQMPNAERTPNMEKQLERIGFYNTDSKNRGSYEYETKIYKSTKSADYKKDRDNLLLNFEAPEHFITAFDHLCRMENKDRFKGVEKCVPDMLDLFLREYKVNKLATEEAFFEIYSVIEKAMKLSLKLSGEVNDEW